MLTVEELAICEKLADCFIAFTQLPIQHPSDIQEFAQAIHECQKTVMSRDAVRNHPSVFHNDNKKT